MAKNKKTTQQHKHLTPLLILTMALMLVVNMVDVRGFLYKASVLDFPNHAPFDGTVYPVEKAVNFVKLSPDKRYAKYDELSPSDFIDVPEYNPTLLKTPTDQLQWGNAEHNLIRNMKIFYSVPYMGNYKLDGLEYAGSHAAVDIKMPENTPVRSIANGTVIKASTQSSGFGHHIVVMHKNVPTLNNPNSKTTLYSSYSHLNDVLVGVGDVVKKGELIAYSGNTGTSTTPHLHFQIDNDNAEWHPFWPFSFQESQAAGLSFFEAVNAGLGKENALQTTVNPIEYVEKYLKGSNATVSSGNSNTTPTKPSNAVSYVDVANSSDDSPTRAVTPKPVVEEKIEKPIANAPRELRVNVKVNEFYQTAERDQYFEISLVDQYGNAYREGLLGEIIVSSADKVVYPGNPLLNSRNFDREGKFKGSFRQMKEGRDKLKVIIGDQIVYSDFFDVVNPEKSFNDVSRSHRYYKAISSLREAGVVKGYEDGSFKPENAVSRVEAAKFIVLAADLQVKSAKTLPFPDVEENAWYKDFISTLYENGVVNGNADGTLNPHSDVNYAEFFKMLFLAMEVEVREPNEGEEWYVPYIEKAQNMDILKANKIDAAKGMNRGEVADAMWKVMEIR